MLVYYLSVIEQLLPINILAQAKLKGNQSNIWQKFKKPQGQIDTFLHDHWKGLELRGSKRFQYMPIRPGAKMVAR